MSDDILFLVGFLFVVLLAFTFSNSSFQGQRNPSIFSNASSTVVTVKPTSRISRISDDKVINVSKEEKLRISGLSKTSGPVGTVVDIRGSGFTASNNVVHFGKNEMITSSDDGRKITFKIPSLIPQTCPDNVSNCVISNEKTQTTVGTYDIYISNANGDSNSVSFKISDSSSSVAKKPQISKITGPKQVLPNSPAAWSLTLNVSKPTTLLISVDWGDSKNPSGQSGTRRMEISEKQTTTLSHSYSTTGKYTIVFKVTDDDTTLSSTYSFPVNVVYAAPVGVSSFSLSNISQSEGPIGTQVVLNGAGFLVSPVTIHFGDGGVWRATAQNYGQTLYFNVPAYINSCDVIEPGKCVAPTVKPVTAGSYPLYVSNELGQVTKKFYFEVTNP